ncbi:regenerating islet-derived protein 4-like [Callorhinchus milii]|uniref:regenerating islet-derived protein 4-like n=1 Tax=Callorhinchus milii TaxID=7868 RepID=UPI00045760DF|nr:regenerating islet-derived protein 4-like [Callorhinchus milii]|eukprot:gi/632961639/ref/XP_007896866.1/ PREDICTED: lectin-like [Callorhinchus milii]
MLTTLAICEKSGLNHHLASIHFGHQNDIIQKFVKKHSKRNRSTWIGLHQFLQNQVFSWTDGSIFGFSKWRTMPGYNLKVNVRCVQMDKNSNFWSITNCNENLPFICGYKIDE